MMLCLPKCLIIQYFSMEESELSGLKFKTKHEDTPYRLEEICADEIKVCWYKKDGHSCNGKDWWKIRTVLREIANGEWIIIEFPQPKEVSNYSVF